MHAGLRLKLNAEATIPEIRLNETIDRAVSLRIHLGVRHEPESKAKELKCGGLPGAPAPDQTV